MSIIAMQCPLCHLWARCREDAAGQVIIDCCQVTPLFVEGDGVWRPATMVDIVEPSPEEDG